MAVALVLALPATALAGNECVPDIMTPNCPQSAGGEPTIADAVTNAMTGDTIYLGPRTFNESVSDGGTKALHFVGDSVGQTTIQGQGVTAMIVSSGSTVSDLSIDLAAGPGNTGLALGGSATNVAISQPQSFKDNIGVD